MFAFFPPIKFLIWLIVCRRIWVTETCVSSSQLHRDRLSMTTSLTINKCLARNFLSITFHLTFVFFSFSISAEDRSPSYADAYIGSRINNLLWRLSTLPNLQPVLASVHPVSRWINDCESSIRRPEAWDGFNSNSQRDDWAGNKNFAAPNSVPSGDLHKTLN